MTRRALVTGATGFIGQGLIAHLLAEGWATTVIHRATTSSKPRLADFARHGAVVEEFDRLSDIPAIVAKSRPDVTFHLATHYLRDHTTDDIPLLIDANISLGTALLDAQVDSDSIVVSAMSFFQFRAGQPSPYSLYSATKQAFADISRYYREVRGLDVREVVLFDTYGPGDTRDKLVPRLLDALNQGTSISMGPSKQPMNLLHVEDVARGLVAATEPGNPPTLALRAPEETTVGEIASLIEGSWGERLDATFNENGTPNNLVTEAGRWKVPAGWAPRVALADGLAQVTRQFRSQATG